MVYRWWTVGGPTLCASWVPGSAVGLATDCSLGPGEFLVIVLKDRINAYDVFWGFFCILQIVAGKNYKLVLNLDIVGLSFILHVHV